MMELQLPSFAKINLHLRITGKRPDGYHNLETLFQTIDLHDLLTFHFEPDSKFEIAINMGGAAIPEGPENLIYKACVEYSRVAKVNWKIRVDVEKRIPAGSGLGGGSSNAACALIALQQICNRALSEQELQLVAGKIGADVPFFLHGGTALGLEKGDRIIELFDAPMRHVLIVPSMFSCSTAAIYQKFDDLGLLTHSGNSINIQNVLRPEFLDDLLSHSANDLEQVVFALYPELESCKKRLISLGAATAALTGSGSAVFGLFSTREKVDRVAVEFPGSLKSEFLSREEYSRRTGLRKV